MTGQTPSRFAYVVYYGLARHLPWSISPGGGVAKRLRRRLCSRMFESCGSDVNVESGAWFGSGRGIHVGDRSALGRDALIMGDIVIGNDVMMGPRVTVLATNHNYSDTTVPMNQQGLSPVATVRIADDVWIGANVTILPGRSIGAGAVVAAGCVVSKDVPGMSIVGGNPMQVLGRR